MIAFAREAPEPEDPSPRPVPLAGPQVLTQQAIGGPQTSDAGGGAPESVFTDVAKEHEELAMLQRALAHCGLV